ncbi:methionyl-tRNA formyltransferase [Megalodesulfovibrio gigas]|uniref:Methionyl-tRNA formyltransferase n=1 Tax=Megalodesulfovibrio gigas (strain ATCC 19364 / DSM 1382 / NCIMB 9332 / VKM B-1759) TaxID=1121448 RepID=T2G994_MEGG1|nr:methionyl-tRNA formyltransferase [Megalodesulfovibrio gigas]AGW12744.1 putative Methionyl-tRNA formyltransferase [Megalodesulfovibrio gigas DSM 1382 = ATCC 19364]
MRIIFMGTPGFAATVLESILSWPQGEVVGVFTQPDRPAGRGGKMRPPEVKQLALARGLPVFQPLTLKGEEHLRLVTDLAPDVAVVAAYGLILPRAVLDAPRYGCLNVHASLLPKYRGAAPIQRAILDGELATGITIMQMDAGLDTGDICLQQTLIIGYQDTAAIIHDELAAMGGALLVKALERLEPGTLPRIPQNSDRATYAAKLRKEEGEIFWNQPAMAVHNRIRAMHPWPGAYTFWKPAGAAESIRLSLSPGLVGEPLTQPVPPGTVLGLTDDQLAVACADKAYLLPSLCPAGRCSMDARAFINGYLSRAAGEAVVLGEAEGSGEAVDS